VRYRPREDLVKFPSKKFALVAAPLLVTGALLGVPLAGSAHALQREDPCLYYRDQASNYFDEYATDFYFANQALQGGDVGEYAYYSYQELLNEDMYHYYNGLANKRGC
jgi:hypothetical protein